MTRRTLFLLLVTVLSGCAAPVRVDTHLAQVLPNSIALDIVSKKMGADWAKAPFVVNWGSCQMIPKDEPISFSDITVINYNKTTGKLFVATQPPKVVLLYTCSHQKFFDMTEDEAREAVAALKALGACTHWNPDKGWSC